MTGSVSTETACQPGWRAVTSRALFGAHVDVAKWQTHQLEGLAP